MKITVKVIESSIIIPTYNRKNILAKCLHSINKQKYNLKNIEVIVVDDGSKDDTLSYLKAHSNKFKFHLRVIHQANQGQGIARNQGIKVAKGHLIIFIGDDIIIDPNCINEHHQVHLLNPSKNIAVLGYITWSNEITITPFMKWLSHGSNILGKYGGHQFAYEKLQNKKEADFNFFYTSNISLKRTLLIKEFFDPDFGKYGWEDIELGYRLTKKYHLKILYNPHAIAYHLHQMDESSLHERMKQIGYSAHIIHQKHPELKKVPGFLKKALFHLLSNSLSLTVIKTLNILSRPKLSHLHYYALSKKYFLEGLNNYLK